MAGTCPRGLKYPQIALRPSFPIVSFCFAIFLAASNAAMELTHAIQNSTIYIPLLEAPTARTHFISFRAAASSISPKAHVSSALKTDKKDELSPTASSSSISPKAHVSSTLEADKKDELSPRTNSIPAVETALPTMFDIVEASRRQKLDLQLHRLGPFFRITAKSLETGKELGKAEGFVRLWFGGKILHLDSIRLRRETLGMEKSIFGIGLFIGAVAIRYGYDCGCKKAELLAINDTDLYHSKLVRFYTRIGFKAGHEVSGSSFGDLAHMLVWGGVGTRMDANVEELMVKWCSRFKPQKLN